MASYIAKEQRCHYKQQQSSKPNTSFISFQLGAALVARFSAGVNFNEVTGCADVFADTSKFGANGFCKWVGSTTLYIILGTGSDLAAVGKWDVNKLYLEALENVGKCFFFLFLLQIQLYKNVFTVNSLALKQMWHSQSSKLIYYCMFQENITDVAEILICENTA